jgi:hypothetical protein
MLGGSKAGDRRREPTTVAIAAFFWKHEYRLCRMLDLPGR